MKIILFAILIAVFIAIHNLEARGGGRGGFGGHGHATHGFGGMGYGMRFRGMGYGMRFGGMGYGMGLGLGLGHGHGYYGNGRYRHWGGYPYWRRYGAIYPYDDLYDDYYYRMRLRLGYGYPYGKRSVFDAVASKDLDENKMAECVYHNSSSILSCKGLNKMVECETTLNLTALKEHHTSFKIGIISSIKYSATEMNRVRFYLYARNAENTAWLNHTRIIDDKLVSLSLFHLSSMPYYGFRVPDLACYTSLFKLFDEFNIRGLSEEAPLGIITIV